MTEVLIQPNRYDGVRQITFNGALYFNMPDYARVVESEGCKWGNELLSIFRKENPGIPFKKVGVKGEFMPGFFCPDAASHLVDTFVNTPAFHTRAEKMFWAVRSGSKRAVASVTKSRIVTPVTKPVIIKVLKLVIVKAPKLVRILATNSEWMDPAGVKYHGLRVIVTGLPLGIRALSGPDNFLAIRDIMENVGIKGWRIREAISRDMSADIHEANPVNRALGTPCFKFIRRQRLSDMISLITESSRPTAVRDASLKILDTTLARAA